MDSAIFLIKRARERTSVLYGELLHRIIMCDEKWIPFDNRKCSA